MIYRRHHAAQKAHRGEQAEALRIHNQSFEDAAYLARVEKDKAMADEEAIRKAREDGEKKQRETEEAERLRVKGNEEASALNEPRARDVQKAEADAAKAKTDAAEQAEKEARGEKTDDKGKKPATGPGTLTTRAALDGDDDKTAHKDAAHKTEHKTEHKESHKPEPHKR